MIMKITECRRIATSWETLSETIARYRQSDNSRLVNFPFGAAFTPSPRRSLSAPRSIRALAARACAIPAFCPGPPKNAFQAGLPCRLQGQVHDYPGLSSLRRFVMTRRRVRAHGQPHDIPPADPRFAGAVGISEGAGPEWMSRLARPGGACLPCSAADRLDRLRCGNQPQRQ